MIKGDRTINVLNEDFNVCEPLIAKLTTILKKYQIDLLIINDTPPALNFEIIKPKVLVRIRDNDLKLCVKQRIMSGYLNRKFEKYEIGKLDLKGIKPGARYHSPAGNGVLIACIV